MSVTMAVAIVFVALLMTPTVRRIARERRRASLFAGGLTIIAGATVLTAAIIFNASFNVEIAVSLFCGLLLVGVFLLWLPRMASNVDAAVAAQREVAAVRKTPRTFSPTTEVANGAREIASNPTPIIHVVGPWFAVYFTLPLFTLDQGFWRTFIHQSRNAASLFLLGFALLMLVQVVVLLAASIQWTRYIATGVEQPWFRVPGKALWGWSWRLLVFGNIFRTMNVEGWLKAHLQNAPVWAINGLKELALYSILVLASPFALVLPAIALGQAGFAASARARGFGLAGRKYYVGMVLILGPYFLMSWLLDVAATQAPSLQAADTMLSVVATFITVIAAVTYMTRVYVKAISAAPPRSEGAAFAAA